MENIMSSGRKHPFIVIFNLMQDGNTEEQNGVGTLAVNIPQNEARFPQHRN